MGNDAPKQKHCTTASWDCFQNYSINRLVLCLDGPNGHDCKPLLFGQNQEYMRGPDSDNGKGSQDHGEVNIFQEYQQLQEGKT